MTTEKKPRKKSAKPGKKELKNQLQELMRSTSFDRSFYVLARLCPLDNTGSLYQLQACVCADTAGVAEGFRHVWSDALPEPAYHEYFYEIHKSVYLLCMNARDAPGLSNVDVSPAITLVDASGVSLKEKYGSYDALHWDLEEDENGDTEFERSGGWEQTKFTLDEDKLQTLVPPLAAPILGPDETVGNPLEEDVLLKLHDGYHSLGNDLSETLLLALREPEFRLGAFDATNVE